MAEVFPGGDGNGCFPGDAKAENVFQIVCDARRVAMPPFVENFVAVRPVPVDELVWRDGYSGFFMGFAAGGGQRCFIGFQAAGDGLPESRVACAFEQQNIQLRAVDQDQG